ncbi:MAG: 2,3-bisphosphoglycerate-independent phosphoglycerate mutase [Acidobacteria bacterium]|nr:2,3-bisphosphoglycerate-independent phosphoglycerate mutase [Acidobacteriota bacterium]MCA1627409.1 2,3-bisphosphoglycerate-independent phosphoglycerate mutase [Acidobacteriota bacterium]
MTKKRGPLALIIIDGWGYSSARDGNAIALATTPFYDEICEKYPQTLLEAHGSRVGLPAGVMGNSEVGHLNIGSGRVIRMDVSLVDHEIETGEFFNNQILLCSVEGARDRGKALHLMGLVSDGQVHSSLTHLYALLKLSKQSKMQQVYIHCFLDGRDTPPSSAVEYLAALQQKVREIGCGEIATVVGRYYAMDRDKRWERTQRAYDLLVHGIGKKFRSPIEAVRQSYERGVTDEFVEPISIVREHAEPVATIKDDDAVIFFNFRPDRARQLTRALAVGGFNDFDVSDRPKVAFACFTMYDRTFDLPIAFPPRDHPNVLAEVFAGICVRNYRLAETEKYAHVTYFFNGGVEKEFACENRLLVSSPKIATYDLQPEMSAFKVTDKVLRGVDDGETDVFVVNFANPDMVGHTGKLDKTIEACQYVDTCLGWITKRMRQARGTTIITADHGNAEQMIDLLTGNPHTAHTTNPVPFHFIDEDLAGLKLREGGALEDVAPTMLAMLGIEKPVEMTGRDLRES